MPMPGVRTKILMIGDRYFLCEEERKYRMNLKEQLKKVMDDQEKLERKKDKFLEEYEKNMDAFLDILKKNSEEFSLEMEIASENLEESVSKPEEHVPDFGK